MDVKEAAVEYLPEAAPQSREDDVPPGYKRTEVGVIPEDWETSVIGDNAETSSGTTPSRQLDERYYYNGGIPWVKTLDLNDNYIESTQERVTKAALSETSLRLLKEGSVLVAMYGGFNQIGRTGLLGMKATVNQALTAIVPDTNKLSSEYLQAVLNFYVKYWKSVASSSRKDPNITGRDIREFPLALPKIAEQQAIATALSGADALIAALQRLIAKKRAIKQGAMQTLLTGRQRLPGFSGEWKTWPLCETTNCLDNLRVPLNESQRSGMVGQIPYCGANGVLDYINDFVVDDDIILIAEDGGHFDEYETRPIAYRMTGKVWVNNHAHILQARQGFNQAFLFYSLVNKNILSYLANGTRAKLNRSELDKIEVLWPRESEQTAIATVLADMDAEIEALEARLAKTRALKAGMMQQLLTGRIRLPLEEAA